MGLNKTCLTETGYEGVDWMHLTQKRNPVKRNCEQDNGSSGFHKMWGISLAAVRILASQGLCSKDFISTHAQN